MFTQSTVHLGELLERNGGLIAGKGDFVSVDDGVTRLGSISWTARFWRSIQPEVALWQSANSAFASAYPKPGQERSVKRGSSSEKNLATTSWSRSFRLPNWSPAHSPRLLCFTSSSVAPTTTRYVITTSERGRKLSVGSMPSLKTSNPLPWL